MSGILPAAVARMRGFCTGGPIPPLARGRGGGDGNGGGVPARALLPSLAFRPRDGGGGGGGAFFPRPPRFGPGGTTGLRAISGQGVLAQACG